MEKIVNLYAPFTRRDDESRIVEGYCYVTPDVGDGLVIPRAVMEEMTTDYSRWANVRMMHQPKPIGTALEIEWDARGCFMRCKIVDDDAWKLVKEGVLRGFSVGVKAKAAKRRGDGQAEMIRGVWFETSLVDRPKDPETPVTVVRAEGEDVEGLDLETEPEVFVRAEELAEAESEIDALSNALAEVQGRAETAETELATARAELNEWLTSGRAALEAERFALRAEVETVRAELATARARVAELEAQPDPYQQVPIKVTAGVVLRQMHTAAEDQANRAESLRAELAELTEKDWTTATQPEKDSALRRIAEIKGLISLTA